MDSTKHSPGPGSWDCEETVVSIDLETTGLSTSRDRIVEVAAVRQLAHSNTNGDNPRRETWSRLVNPGVKIPAFVTAIHGISDADVANAPKFKDIAADLRAFIGEKTTLCGHNLWRFDLPLLQSELARAGMKPLKITDRLVVDSLVIFRKMEPHTLAKAAEFYCNKQLKKAHRAANDAEAALDVFLAQKTKYAAAFASGSSPGTGHEADMKQLSALSTGALRSPNLALSKPTTLPSHSKSHSKGDNVCRQETKDTKDTKADDEYGGKLHRDGQGRLVFSKGKHKGKTVEEVAKSDVPYLKWIKRSSTISTAFRSLIDQHVTS